jgi:hypothetical protein
MLSFKTYSHYFNYFVLILLVIYFELFKCQRRKTKEQNIGRLLMRPDEARQQATEHHNQELRDRFYKKCLEIFYYPVKYLMDYVESKKSKKSKNIFRNIQDSVKLKDISNITIDGTSASYTVNITLKNDGDADDNFIFETTVNFSNIEEFNSNTNTSGGYKKRKISKRKRISKRRRISKRKRISKKRKISKRRK